MTSNVLLENQYEQRDNLRKFMADDIHQLLFVIKREMNARLFSQCFRRPSFYTRAMVDFYATYSTNYTVSTIVSAFKVVDQKYRENIFPSVSQEAFSLKV